jgi:hypothetical protein
VQDAGDLLVPIRKEDQQWKVISRDLGENLDFPWGELLQMIREIPRLALDLDSVPAVPLAERVAEDRHHDGASGSRLQSRTTHGGRCWGQ